MIRLDISIGPVQGFVAQSRRTRDLWGSSYLLSFLAAHACHGASKAGARNFQPSVKDDPLYCWVSGERVEEPPLASLPNHFRMCVDDDQVAEAVAKAALADFNQAWWQVYDAVWHQYVDEACGVGKKTRDIWDRQVRRFWEVTWTAGNSSNGSNSNLLARRKHWRASYPPEEPGDKCTVMHEWQELSGYTRATSREQRAGQDDFWKQIRNRTGELNLRENERLCAIALVKRLFPTVSRKAIGWELDTESWPSTVHMAARPWIRQVACNVSGKAKEYAKEVERHAPKGVRSERPPDGLGNENEDEEEHFAQLDANWFHRDYVNSDRLCPLKEEDKEEAARQRQDLLGRLTEIYAVNKTHTADGAPLSFYALLLADGDRLGKLVHETSPEEVGNALKEFTCKVPEIVSKHDGEVVYAGGDDVLAMLPLERALECAERLSKCYRSSFVGRQKATLSAALVYAHIKLPMRHVLDEAHRLLDKVAKEGNGRNSLAVTVMKPSGVNCLWTSTWERQDLEDTTGASTAVGLLRKLVDRLEKSNAGETAMSRSLLYRLRQLLATLCDWEAWRPGKWYSVPEGIDLAKFIRAEIEHSLSVNSGDPVDQQAKQLTGLVESLLQRSKNADRQEKKPDLDALGLDALVLAGFLADPAGEGN